MGVWVRGVVLALGLVLAGCVSDEDGYRSFPELDLDYIEVSSSTMMGSIGPSAWRIYSNNIVYSQTFARNQTVIRDRIEDGLFDRVLRFVKTNGFSELESLESEAGVICPAFEIQQPNGETLIGYLTDHPIYRYAARIEGEDFAFSMSQCFNDAELSEYETRLWVIFQRVRIMIR